MKIRKLVAAGLIAGSLSVGAAGVAIGAGTASAQPRPGGPDPCAYTVCNYHKELNMKATGEFVPWYTKYLGLHPTYQ